MMVQLILWTSFAVTVIGLLVLDLVWFHRKDKEVSIKDALIWSVFWTVLALIFNVVVYYFYGAGQALNFFTGYMLERTLSFDNLFVFLLVFTYFKVPAEYHHKILFWGILGALVMRAVFILAGVAVVHQFRWVLYLFGILLVWSGIQFVIGKDEEVDPEKNPVLRLFRKIFPITDTFEGGKFFIRRDGRLWATPLVAVLLVIETSDVIFAVDSIPAIFGITLDPMIIYTSNIFAILGLRALYFALAGLMKIFKHLNYGLALILVFIGVKMLIADIFHIPVWVALSVIMGTLGVCILTSIYFGSKNEDAGTS
ncbi:MAG: TerC family protein [Candidatus Omnitrophica bacterium]|nr:TerC family protein [Candidatus Omnitrophota bacterium]MDD5670872.1 TerC family protein [Candidatus Omnitrophota bacterium]